MKYQRRRKRDHKAEYETRKQHGKPRDRAQEYLNRSCIAPHANVVNHNTEPPPEVLAERERNFAPYYPNAMGDPLPGRSALDQMGGRWEW